MHLIVTILAATASVAVATSLCLASPLLEQPQTLYRTEPLASVPGPPRGRAARAQRFAARGARCIFSTPRPWAPTAGKVSVGSGRGATSPRSHSEPNIDVASDGSHRAVRFDEPGHRLGRTLGWSAQTRSSEGRWLHEAPRQT